MKRTLRSSPPDASRASIGQPRGRPRLGMIAAAAALSFAPLTRADTVLDWNVVALRTTAAGPFNPPLETRSLAIVHAAMFDAVNSIAREFWPYLVDVHAPAGTSAGAAAAAAAHHVLARLYPAQKEALDAALEDSLSRIPAGPSRSGGVTVGVTVAERLLALRASDGAEQAVTAPYTPRGGVGAWAPTPPAFRPALDPGWASVTPFVLRTGDQFRPGPPPAVTTERYALDFAEIRALGSAGSTTRSQAQSDLARLWVATAPQVWNPVARQAATARALGPTQSARLLALLNLAGADAFIAAWDAKFAYEQWRPVTAIRAAGGAGDPDTAADPSWTPLLVTPPFPDYIAGHTTYAGAVAKVLAEVLGDPPGLTLAVKSSTAPGVQVTYSSFEDMAEDVVGARVWGGVHWRTSCTKGKRVGERIGRYAVGRFLRPADESRERVDDDLGGED